MIQITEQLTENCFTVINFNNIAFRFHPNKTIDEIRKRLQSDNDHTEIVLTHTTETDTELIIDQADCLLGDLNPDQFTAQSLTKSNSTPEYIVRDPDSGSLSQVRVNFTEHTIQW